MYQFRYELIEGMQRSVHLKPGSIHFLNPLCQVVHPEREPAAHLGSERDARNSGDSVESAIIWTKLST
jgi:hypothetical protein